MEIHKNGERCRCGLVKPFLDLSLFFQSPRAERKESYEPVDYIKQFEEEEEKLREDERRAKEELERKLREEERAKEVHV